MSALRPAPAPIAAPAAAYDVAAIRAQFPIFRGDGGTRPPVYLDSAATSQKPQVVLDRLHHFLAHENANIHRGVYALSARATEAFESARARVARFLNAPEVREVIFTRGTTEGINLVAQSWGRSALLPGDEILVTAMEHHSNLVPWQIVASQTGARVVAAPILDDGTLDRDAFARLISPRTKLVALVHLSNSLGTINPVAELCAMAKAAGAVVLVDAAQSAPHLGADVQALGCDFLACSAHKLFGPTGIGALWGREALLDAMPPWQGGGDMIASVTLEGSTWAALPAKFEAGTPAIAEAVAFATALDWIEHTGREAIHAHEQAILAYATERVGELPGVRLIGTAPEKAAVLAFTMEGIHPHDIGTLLDERGICIRAGHHCTQPVMRRFGVPATARASVGPYTTRAEIDALVSGLVRAREVFG